MVIKMIHSHSCFLSDAKKKSLMLPMDQHMCHLLYILLNNAELDILQNSILDICSFYAVQVLLSPRYWCQAGQLGSLSAKWIGWL